MTADETGLAIDWAALTQAARHAQRRAYAPYSQFPVGAAALASGGRTLTGCNVENASYGLTLCAECGLISALYASGGGLLHAVVCVGPGQALLMPCGRCRQLLHEHAAPTCPILTDSGPLPIESLIPAAFGKSDLARAAAETPLRTPPHIS